MHDLQRFERFVRLCAGRVGQLVNLTSLGNDAGVSHATVNPDYFRGLRSFAAAFPAALEGGNVVYGGDADQRRSDWPVFGWRRLQHPPAQ